MTSTLSRPAPGRAPAPPRRRTRPPGTDPWHWAVTAAVLLAVLAAATSLNGVVEPWTWLRPVAGTVAPALLAAALVRTLRPGGIAAALGGVLGLVGALTAQFLPRHSVLGVIPGPGARDEIGRLLARASETVVSEVAPVVADEGILLLICAALGAIALLIDVLATTLRIPAVSGLALLVVMIPSAVVKPTGVGMTAFLATVLGYLLVLAAVQWRENRLVSHGARASSGFLGRSAVIAVVALSVTVLLPPVIPGFTSGAFPQGSRVSIWGTAAGLNPAVTLGNDLRNPSGSGRITYSTSSQTPVYLRAVTLEDFSGSRWEPDQRIEDRRTGVLRIGAERGAPETTTGQTVYTRIETQNYTSPWLLSPYAPEAVIDLAGSWSWDPANLSVIATDGGSTAGQDYLVRSRAATPTREALADVRPSDGTAVPEVFSELPDDTPEIVLDTTDEVTENLVSPYGKALALQDFLRGPGFAYSEEAPVEGGYDTSGMTVMARFLQERSGYCVHYAGTMAVMARAAGIPSRVAIGYTPGSPTGETSQGPGGLELEEFTVDSRNAHAWPELHFEGVGWVRFEPTPSRGVVPNYAQQVSTPGNVRADDSDALDPDDPRASDASAAARPTDPPAPGSPTEGAPGPAAWEFLAAAGLLLLLAVPLALRTITTESRRRIAVRAPGGRRAAVLSWAEVTDQARDHGYPIRPAETPRGFARRLGVAAGLDDRATASLEALRSAYERAEYAEPAPTMDAVVDSPVAAAEGTGSARVTGSAEGTGPARVAATARATESTRGTETVPARADAAPGWDDVAALTRALRGTGSPIARIRARLLPRSLWKIRRDRGSSH